jgi:putative N6-adenine-specific DNA methylase
MSGRSHRAAVVCVPGLEHLCQAELRRLGVRPKPAGPGLLEFEGNTRQLYAVNVWLRTASRVVVRLAKFRATDFVHLQEHAARIPWNDWIEPGRAPAFRVTSTESKLYHTKAIAQRLHQVSLPPSIGEPEQLFIVRIHRNTVTISVDASGDALHHRPWRTELGEAPLRTTMAAAALMACDWSGSTPLIDPFCGSGTIAIEAALMARGLPPGGEREFAFHRWPMFDTGAWASVAGSVQAAYQAVAAGDDVGPEIVATDRDPTAVAMALGNAHRAEVADMMTVERRVVSHLKGRPDRGLLLTNPPYGKRMGTDRLTGLYRRLGAISRERLPNFDLAVITSHVKLARAADRGLRSIAGFRHGGLAVELYHRPAGAGEAEKGSGTGESDQVADGAGQLESAG